MEFNKTIVVLDSATLGKIKFAEHFLPFGKVIIHQGCLPSEVPDRIKNANIVITNKAIIGKEAIDMASDLELICVAATGMNNIDLNYGKLKNVIVKNVSGYSTNSVVQQTFALLLGMLNQIQFFDNYCKDVSGYRNSSIFTHFGKEIWEISGKTVGIIGLGTIGKKVAEVAKVFEANVIYYSTSGKNNSSDYERVTLEELFTRSDIVSIHAPLNENTKNLITIKQLQLLKTHAVLLNTGRGGIINEFDLAKALDENMLAMAALDVFEVEPITENNPLLSIKNPAKLLLSPHIAWASVEARNKLIQGVVDNIKNHLVN